MILFNFYNLNKLHTMNDVIEIDTWIQNKINSFFDKYINYYFQKKMKFLQEHIPSLLFSDQVSRLTKVSINLLLGA